MCHGLAVLALTLLVGTQMLSKSKRPYDPESLPPSSRLRANVRDIWSNQGLTSARVVELAEDVNRVAPRELPDVASVKRDWENQARDVRRLFLKHSKWPNLYYAKVRLLDNKTQEEKEDWLAIRLPHEYVECLHKHGNLDALLGTSEMDPKTLAHLQECKEDAGCDLLGIGVWGDEMPCNWDRSESVAGVSMNLPGLGGQWKGLRLPLTALPAKQVGPNTWFDVFDVLRWSFTILATGVQATARHDNSEWLPSDKKGGKSARCHPRPVPLRAALCEVRADWVFLNKVFHFPNHNTNEGCCWICTCTPQQALGSSISFLTVGGPPWRHSS